MFLFFFFNDTATTEIYTLSLHDALPISGAAALDNPFVQFGRLTARYVFAARANSRRVGDADCADPVSHAILYEVPGVDRKSTRLNSSHANISYAVFCLKKKKKMKNK